MMDFSRLLSELLHCFFFKVVIITWQFVKMFPGGDAHQEVFHFACCGRECQPIEFSENLYDFYALHRGCTESGLSNCDPSIALNCYTSHTCTAVTQLLIYFCTLHSNIGFYTYCIPYISVIKKHNVYKMYYLYSKGCNWIWA